jgi:hypothetical protein
MISQSAGELVVTTPYWLLVFWFLVGLVFFVLAAALRNKYKDESRGNFGAGIICMLVLCYQYSYEARLGNETGKVYSLFLRNDHIRWSEATRATVMYENPGMTLYITDTRGKRFSMPLEGAGKENNDRVLAFIQSRIPVSITHERAPF